eukprot:TRINITY_DN14216_c0_g1_i1.p1 TRINITY_DN14216_c0_g1~~TRINITY_DN14216_c0_g1_i1.p1  ORF type:complete len:124 (+),score=32.74 TRINITY_DN14216_c0_g1_i1:64-435(+)
MCIRDSITRIMTNQLTKKILKDQKEIGRNRIGKEEKLLLLMLRSKKSFEIGSNDRDPKKTEPKPVVEEKKEPKRFNLEAKDFALPPEGEKKKAFKAHKNDAMEFKPDKPIFQPGANNFYPEQQ